jgi:uncharacterized protein with HEPN domain
MKPFMLRNDFYLLLSLLETINKVLRFSSGYQSAEEFFQNDRDFDAAMMNFIVMGEIVGKISDKLKEETTEVDWAKIYSFRNILAHHYFGINVDIVWQIIQNDLPGLKDQINYLLEK